MNLDEDPLELDKIVNIMSRKEWNADTLDEIAGVLRRSGREIKDLEDNSEESDIMSRVVWGHDVPVGNGRPATVEEINDAIDDIRLRAIRITDPSGYVSIDLRVPVAKAVEEALENCSTAFAISDPESNGEITDETVTLYVFSSEAALMAGVGDLW
jgi:hypothetical protein